MIIRKPSKLVRLWSIEAHDGALVVAVREAHHTRLIVIRRSLAGMGKVEIVTYINTEEV